MLKIRTSVGKSIFTSRFQNKAWPEPYEWKTNANFSFRNQFPSRAMLSSFRLITALLVLGSILIVLLLSLFHLSMWVLSNFFDSISVIMPDGDEKLNNRVAILASAFKQLSKVQTGFK